MTGMGARIAAASLNFKGGVDLERAIRQAAKPGLIRRIRSWAAP